MFIVIHPYPYHKKDNECPDGFKIMKIHERGGKWKEKIGSKWYVNAVDYKFEGKTYFQLNFYHCSSSLCYLSMHPKVGTSGQ